MKEDRKQHLREVEESVSWQESRSKCYVRKLFKAINNWIALCIFCAALGLSGSSPLPLPSKTISGRKRRLLH